MTPPTHLSHRIRSFSTSETPPDCDLHSLTHPFISSRLDYCNGALFWCSQQIHGQAPVCPKLTSPLPSFKFHFSYKMLLLTYKSLPPPNSSHPRSPTRTFCSTDSGPALCSLLPSPLPWQLYFQLCHNHPVEFFPPDERNGHLQILCRKLICSK